MMTVTAGVTTVVGLVLTGTCFGVGFWLSKKATNRIDRFFLERDPQFPHNLYPQET